MSSRVLESLHGAVPQVPPAVGVVVVVVLVVALGAKVVLQSRTGSARRQAPRLLDAVIAPLLVAFVIIVLERLRDLS